MTFLKRLRLYLIGVGIGIVVVYFIFRNRQFDAWLPEGRVVEQLMRSNIAINPDLDCRMNCLGMDTTQLKVFLKTADVDFGKSDPRREPCPIYHIEGIFQADELEIRIESCQDEAELLCISAIDDRCDC